MPSRQSDRELRVLAVLVDAMLYPISTPKANSAEDLIGFINAEGNVVVRPTYAAGAYFFEGKAAVVDHNGKAGFINDVGKLVIPCRFKGLGKFRNGLCSINGGFIDHTGKWLIEPRFLVASEFSEGRAFSSLDGERFGFIDLRGDVVIRPDFQQCRLFSEGFAGVCRDDRWGFLDHSGEMRIPHVFEAVRPQGFRYGVAGVQIDGRWGFIDPSGNFIVKPEYEDLKSFSEGLASVRRDGKWGMINLDGTLIVDFKFTDLGELEGGMTTAKLNGKTGFISSNGSWVIQPVFDRCYRFFGKLAVVRNEDVYSYLRRDGETVWNSAPGALVQAPPGPA